MKRAVALSLLLLPAAAWASGSSTVFADSRYFRVAIESVRKIFAADRENPDAESNWHAEWKRASQPRVDKLRAAPFQYRFRFEDVYVSLAFKRLPSEAARRAIKERLQKRLPK